MGEYENYLTNAQRWEIKEAFDNFFNDVNEYLHMRIDDKFNEEIRQIMDQVWKKQMENPSQFFTC